MNLGDNGLYFQRWAFLLPSPEIRQRLKYALVGSEKTFLEACHLRGPSLKNEAVFRGGLVICVSGRKNNEDDSIVLIRGLRLYTSTSRLDN